LIWRQGGNYYPAVGDKETYQKKIEEMKAYYSSKCHTSYIDYVPVTTSTPYDKVLFAYLIKRQKLL